MLFNIKEEPNTFYDEPGIAKLSSSSSPVELSTALILIISTPTHPHPG